MVLMRKRLHLSSLLRLQALVLFLCGNLWPQAEVREPPPAPPPPVDAAPGVGSRSGPGGIVAIAGPDVITQAELDKRVQQSRAQLAELYPSSVLEGELARISWMTLERMIDNKLVLQLVKREEEKNEGRSFVSEVDVDRALERQLEFHRERSPMIRTTEDLYRMVRETQGLSRDEYRKFLKEQIAIEGYLRQNVLRYVDSFVSPEAARLYYKTHLDEFTNPVEISFRYILIRLSREDAWARRLAVHKGIKENQPFLELAKKYSEEAIEGDADAAGRLWRKSFEELKSWHSPIPEVLRKLKKGQVSEGILTVRGLQYFYVEDVVEGKPRTFSEAQEDIRKKIREAREQSQLDDFMKQLRKKTYTRNFLPRPDEESKGKEEGKGKEQNEGKEETRGKEDGKATKSEKAGGMGEKSP